MKTVLILVMVLFLNSCGVDTSSSSKGTASTTKPIDVIDQNPIGGDTPVNPETPVGPGNPVNPENPTGTTDPNCDEVSVYECENALYDLSSCSALTHKTASDTSYNGTDPAENGSDFFSIKTEGLGIRSEYLEGNSADLYKTWVTLYYKSFPDKNNLGLQGYTGYVKSGFFYVTYDIAWSDTSIAGIDRIMYVKTNQGAKPACYRLTLNNVDGTQIDVQKVYR
ncbi:hypothetical protein JHD49_04380 [Sulfurimonas sp. SAG-AH-194-C21]|nr:hypothetical protein [Sulfurimonas sp. SAG-AH-194-C21]MDF1883168.1 hypothetical protein [Sulfurimonas sp. SAG-AH-194-C21]